MSHQESEHEAEEREPRHGKKGPRKPRPFGILYAYARWVNGGREKWYTTRAGRDQAFKSMSRDNERRLPNGKTWSLYKSIEKIEK